MKSNISWGDDGYPDLLREAITAENASKDTPPDVCYEAAMTEAKNLIERITPQESDVFTLICVAWLRGMSVGIRLPGLAERAEQLIADRVVN